ncbi:putative RING finger protein C548.05c like protein [Argiope bruennichi]|uniref:Putative RING finger protein C548.05c like protein n=1 Tax=Argiope bruennichi TaxID=94029 RepID=A0A8T0FK18_ARGBR|nr:putative RING finger protein C548.05c like protein [Argiope bruennichi]
MSLSLYTQLLRAVLEHLPEPAEVNVGEAHMEEMVNLVKEMIPTIDVRFLPVISEKLKSVARKRDELLWCLWKMEGIPYLIEFAMAQYFKYDRHMCQIDKWIRLGELNIQSVYSSPGPESCLGKPSDCPICTEPLHRNITASCGHNFHGECLEMWMKENMSCPMCRKNLCGKNVTTWQFRAPVEARAHFASCPDGSRVFRNCAIRRTCTHVPFPTHGIHLPVEIGIAEVLADGQMESQRQTLLLTINHSNDYMTMKDRRTNRVGSENSSTLPATFQGDMRLEDGWMDFMRLEEAHRRVRQFVGQELVAVKGEEAKKYFKCIGLPRVVDIKTQIAGDCPRVRELKSTTRENHFAHLILGRCSRVIAVGYAGFLEERRKEERKLACDDWTKDPGEYIPPPVRASTPPPVLASTPVYVNMKFFDGMDTITFEKKPYKFVFQF